MSMRFKGGVISATPPTITPPVDGEGGSASGVWTLQTQLQNAAVWPKPVIAGQLWSTGANDRGQLGLNDTAYRSSPVQIGALTGWTTIAVGNNAGAAIKTDGTLWAWGFNSTGQLGISNVVDRSSPVQVGALTTWQKVAYGNYFAAAIKTDGTLWAWGSGGGQLGLGDGINRSSPTQVGLLTNWAQITTGRNFCAAVKTDGTLWTWGLGAQGASRGGMLGLGNTTSYSSPKQVGALTGWLNVAAGGNHCIATKTDGTLWAWGSNGYGQVGDGGGYVSPGNYSNRSSPVQIGSLTTWSKISAGYAHSLAIKTDGTLWVWGGGSNGTLGLNATNNRSSPVQVGALTNWLQASGGFDHCAAVKTDGTLWTWGRNNNGELGQNNTTDRSSPVQVGALTTWAKVARGQGADSVIALKTS